MFTGDKKMGNQSLKLALQLRTLNTERQRIYPMTCVKKLSVEINIWA